MLVLFLCFVFRLLTRSRRAGRSTTSTLPTWVATWTRSGTRGPRNALCTRVFCASRAGFLPVADAAFCDSLQGHAYPRRGEAQASCTVAKSPLLHSTARERRFVWLCGMMMVMRLSIVARMIRGIWRIGRRRATRLPLQHGLRPRCRSVRVCVC